MKRAREFNNILDDCLERILVGDETIEQCLARYSEYATELEPLLRTVLDTKEATAIKPRPEFRERARYQFQAALREMEPKKSHGFFSRQPRWATALIVVIVLLLAGSSTVAAANNSMPDEPLYQVKLATEAVRLTLTPSTLGKAELYVNLTDKRVNEIINMADKGKAEQVKKAAGKLDEYLIAMANLPLTDIEESIRNQETEQTMLVAPEETPQPQEPSIASAPAEPETPSFTTPTIPTTPTVPAPPPVIEVAPQPAVEEPVPVDEKPMMAVPKASGPSDKARMGNGGGRDEAGKSNAELRQSLSRKAAENLEALHVALEEAPESAKPALRQAIEVAISAYDRALSSLD